MKSKNKFTLQPFNLSKSNLKIEIAGNIYRQKNQLNLEYLVQGDLSTIIVPAPNSIPLRKNELWQTTCFEFFIGIKDSAQYWEFNLAPTGNWNVYRFTDYRQGMVEETALEKLPFKLTGQSNSLQLNLAITLDPIINSDTKLEIAITTVIESQNKEISYWALAHPESNADFHDRTGFLITC